MLPLMRKLALPEMHTFENVAASPQPPAAEPIPVEPLPAPWPPSDGDTAAHLPPFDGKQIAPGSRPPQHRWLTWAPVALVALVIVAAFQSISLPPIPTLAAFVGLMILSAVRFLPREGSSARRRLPRLAVLPLPWIMSLLAGPVADHFTNGGEARIAGIMIPLHYGLLMASAALPFVLMPAMREARRFTLILGILNFVLTFLTTSLGIIGPGS